MVRSRRDPFSWRVLAAVAAAVLTIGVIVLRVNERPEVTRPLPVVEKQIAYLWQRVWTEQVRAAVAEPGPITELRVLALEVNAEGALQHIAVDLSALAAGPARAVPVIRIDGRRPPLGARQMRTALQSLLADWSAAGLYTGMLELDHDCARSGLVDYGNWIAQLREDWPDGPAIAITGLPDWLNSPDLGFLRGTVDEFTLQVHAASDPEAGLFDAQRAIAWVERLDALSDTPYDVALPTYAARIRGELHWALPEDIAAVFSHWQQQRPRWLRGVKFFRLPVSGDANTWSPATFAALIKGEVALPRLELEQRSGPAGATDLALYNPTEFDAPLPQRILADALCEGDGSSGYRFQRGATESALEALEADRLAPGRRRTLGWIRCPKPVEFRLESP